MEEKYFEYEVWVEDKFTKDCLVKGMQLDCAELLVDKLFEFWCKQSDLQITIKRIDLRTISDEEDTENYRI